MKLRLEQARLTLEVSKQGANQFVIIDPAFVPIKPTKPNKKMIVAAGFIGGVFLGIFLALIGELLDTRIRTPKDIERYDRPIVALLPEAVSRKTLKR